MSRPLPTLGGIVTPEECYIKLIDHLDNVIDLCHTIGHLRKADETAMSDLLAKGWHGMAAMFDMTKKQVQQLAMRRMN